MTNIITMHNNPLLELIDISKGYHDGERFQQVLEHVNLTLDPGMQVALRGESGIGKSTLLYLCGLLECPDQGDICFQHQSLLPANDHQLSNWRRQHLGFIFQQYNLVDGLSVYDNITMLRRLNHQPADAPWTQTLIERLGLGSLLHRDPHHLSGGQQQRVAVARALAHQPSLILADEPTGNLDERHSHEVMKLLCDFAASAGATLLLVTHSSAMADYCQQQWTLHNGRLSGVTGS